MKFLILTTLILNGIQANAMDCAQIAAAIKARASVVREYGDRLSNWDFQAVTVRLAEINMLIQTYHDACGPLPKADALYLSDLIINKKR